MSAYYNEIDPKAAAWLRELVKQGHIADGEVDERSIADVRADDLRGFAQCHFFAGIGVWSHALRLAGWSDDREVWTGSCPCQPFSVSGKGKGFADDRHLWPFLSNLIAERRPPVVFGEQVAEKAGATWFDLVRSDLEGEDYACGMVVFPACSVGSPMLRKRLYWLAHDDRIGWDIIGEGERSQTGLEEPHGHDPSGRGENGVMGITRSERLEGHRRDEHDCDESGRIKADAAGSASQASSIGIQPDPSEVNGFWGDADWIGCTDGRFRPVEHGTFPLADGIAHRVGKLRGYGNAIVAPQAQIWIETYLEMENSS